MTSFLIVDDHPAFRAEARVLLEHAGLGVIGEAADGRTALQAARDLDPDAVLLDIGLPDTTGFEVLEQLRANGVHAAVILTSTREAAAYGPRIAEGDAAGFIQKDELSGPLVLALLERCAGGG
jgi:DNA-binding NarL/FixJ family response regulator